MHGKTGHNQQTRELISALPTKWCTSKYNLQDSNTERFKRTLIYYDTDTQYANYRGNPLRQTKKTTLKQKLND